MHRVRESAPGISRRQVTRIQYSDILTPTKHGSIRQYTAVYGSIVLIFDRKCEEYPRFPTEAHQKAIEACYCMLLHISCLCSLFFVCSRNTPIVGLALHWHDNSDERRFTECVCVCVFVLGTKTMRIGMVGLLKGKCKISSCESFDTLDLGYVWNSMDIWQSVISRFCL